MAFQNRNFNRRDNRDNSAPREMFDAVCAKCGNQCQVPFNPNGKKDVFCSNCFQASRGDNNSRPPRRFDSHRQNNFSRPFPNRDLEAINEKLDKILSLISK